MNPKLFIDITNFGEHFKQAQKTRINYFWSKQRNTNLCYEKIVKHVNQ